MQIDNSTCIWNSKEFSAKYTSTQTHTVVEPFPAFDPTNARIVIDFLYVGGDALGTLQLEDDTNTVIPGYFFVFGASIPTMIDKEFLKNCPLGRGLRLTTTGGGNHAVIIKYHFEMMKVS